MKVGMHKILSEDNNYPQNDSTECDSYDGAQTFIGITKNHLVEVKLTSEKLLEEIFSPANLNLAYKQVVRNAGAGGIDKMEVDKLLPYLKLHKDELLESLFNGRYTPNLVRRVDIPKGDGKRRPLNSASDQSSSH